MKKSLFTFLFSVLALSAMSQTPAFPGAEGFGRYVTGGRGGKVYIVTTLEDTYNEGSLRYAVNQSGTRTIVFNVTGTIQLKENLQINYGNVTIAGQTAPGEGICLAGNRVTIGANNVIIRFIRCRLGDINNVEGDALGALEKKDIIIDHCSVSWSTDECLSVYGNENTTVQWCLISQSLRTSVHTKGSHGYGGIVGGQNASYHHNLLAHHDSRTPRLGTRPKSETEKNENFDMRNNVIYNWAGNGCYGGEGMKANIVNNYYKPGPATDVRGTNIQSRIISIGVRIIEYVPNDPLYHQWGRYFIDGNKIVGNDAVTKDNWPLGVYAQTTNNANCDFTYTDSVKAVMRLNAPLDCGVITTHSADAAYTQVLKYAGCSLYRDKLDKIIVDDVTNRKYTYGNSSGVLKGIIDSQSELMTDPNDPYSAWPVLAAGSEIIDVDKDGIPDGWLQKKYPGKKPTDLNAEGYTYLEVYLNSIVTRVTASQNDNNLLSIRETVLPKSTITYNNSNKSLQVTSTENMTGIEVFNIFGKRIISTQCHSSNEILDMSGVPNGIYLVQPSQNNARLPASKIRVY